MRKSGVSFLDKFTLDLNGNVIETSQPVKLVPTSSSVNLKQSPEKKDFVSSVQKSSPVTSPVTSPKIMSPTLENSLKDILNQRKIEKTTSFPSDKRKSLSTTSVFSKIEEDSVLEKPRNRKSLPETDQINLMVKNSERRKSIIQEEEKKMKNIMNVPPRKKSTPNILSEDEQRIKSLIKKYLN